jgi:hypothetical protein
MRRLQHIRNGLLDQPELKDWNKRLWKISHKICKNKKRTHMDNHIRNIEENIKDKQIRNAYKELGSLKAIFQPHTDLCRGTNNEILSKEEEINTRWKTYFQDLLTTTATADHGNSLEATYANQADTEEELKEEPTDILEIEIAMQSMNNNKPPAIDNIPQSFTRRGEDYYSVRCIVLLREYRGKRKCPQPGKRTS